MTRNRLQEAAEVLEELVVRDSKGISQLTVKEFMALNAVLLHLEIKGDYVVPDKYRAFK